MFREGSWYETGRVTFLRGRSLLEEEDASEPDDGNGVEARDVGRSGIS